MERTAIRTCPLCEATCGLAITLDGDDVKAVRGDAEDVFSSGFLCPKGVALKQLHDDRDRITTPLIKQSDGTFAAATWDEAFDHIAARLEPILQADRNAVATYLGNPNAHLLANMLYGPVLLRALGSNNRYSASTVDQFPKQMASALMFGTGTTIPVPDVDRTDHLLILGANPLASNGSLMTAPDMRGRLKRLRARGGKLVVIDPRRSRTAAEADEHHFIRPGADALLLFALVNVLFEERLTAVDKRIAAITNGIETVAQLSEPFTPEAVAAATGIAAEQIRHIARELAQAPSAAVYGRIGTCTQEFGTTASWLVDVLNVLTGNLDREGGAMFPMGAAGHSNAVGPAGSGRGARFGRFSSRVRGLPEIFGELPVACLAEEIETPGEGQVKALITISGNPAVSTPNSNRLAAALEQLEFMVSLDIYVNETTRHADVILPAPSPLRRSHYDLALYLFAVRNVANYSPPVLGPDPTIPDEWVTLLRLAGIAFGLGPDADVQQLDEQVARTVIDRELKLDQSPFYGRTQDEVLAELEPRVGPERLLDLQLRVGPYRLTLADLEDAPHGIDLGPLKQRLPDALRTQSGMIELVPEAVVADVDRLIEALDRGAEDGELVLVGRRHLRSNNSWMHNLPLLVSGPVQCTLHVHPDDAARHELVDGEQAEVRSRTGTVHAQVEVTDAIMPGVVSLPHGWGHDVDGVELAVAAEHPGTNSNILADEQLLDAVSGNAVLNGIPVELAPVRAAAAV
ncbi:MAG TPA: molybdopterin-dependent oxidoreductase [Solirubrobacteraceae bacterium]|nr:molybdopterin-dependent oxidoreductase [Solirubrobacteraceae bacterium]